MIIKRAVESREVAKAIGPEFIANALKEWCMGGGCNTAYIPPGSPLDNLCVESFNTRFRYDSLTIQLFTSVKEAKTGSSTTPEEITQRSRGGRPWKSSSNGLYPPLLVQLSKELDQ